MAVGQFTCPPEREYAYPALPSGVIILNLIPTCRTLRCVRSLFVRCGAAQSLGFFFPALLPAIPLQLRIRIVYLPAPSTYPVALDNPGQVGVGWGCSRLGGYRQAAVQGSPPMRVRVHL